MPLQPQQKEEVMSKSIQHQEVYRWFPLLLAMIHRLARDTHLAGSLSCLSVPASPSVLHAEEQNHLWTSSPRPQLRSELASWGYMTFLDTLSSPQAAVMGYHGSLLPPWLEFLFCRSLHKPKTPILIQPPQSSGLPQTQWHLLSSTKASAELFFLLRG